jgi:glycosyltransferase involved in cell wall biosynthesis
VNKDVNTCIVVPCYNEEKNFSVEKFEKVISKHSDIRLCFVDDGSTDRTPFLLEKMKKLQPKRIDVITLLENKGKAEAVRIGIKHCNRSYNHSIIAFLDADLSTSLEECMEMRSYLNNEVEFCFASRIVKKGSNIQIKKHRFIIGRLLNPIIWRILDMRIYDTQCGCKLFKTELSKKIFEDEYISRWLFDIEIFLRIINMYGIEFAKCKIYEAPIRSWIDSKDSKVKFTYIFQLFYDLYKINKTKNLS